jgi:hypothetical protein
MRKLSRTSVTVTAFGSVLALAGTALTTTVGADAAAPPSSQRTIANANGPVFQIARRKGTTYYTDGVGINKITRSGASALVLKVGDAAGVEFSANGKTMAIAHGSPGGLPQRVSLVRKGRRTINVNTLAYEKNVNPDKNVTYGITTGASPACKAELETPAPGTPPGQTPPATYKGLVDSHPYQLAPLRGGAFALADAGGNDILRIGPRGRVSRIALLPPQPITLTTAQANAAGAPDCAGETYAFEPVPTDVERGPHGSLLVTTLPGGPESPALGARGSVYRISKRGVVTRLATGFLGATNVATYKGRIYVTEFFTGKITKFGKGGRFTKATVPGAVSIEATKKKLYIGTASFSGPSRVVRIPR